MIYKKTILITGASGKIGSEIFNDLSKKKYNVIATYFNKKIKINSSKKNIIVKKLNQSNEKSIIGLINFIKKKKN